MPLVAHRPLASLERIRAEGHEVLTIDRASNQRIRELHIGLLNMMPDGALQATERQFLRLIGNANRIAQIYVHIFTVAGVPRAPEMQRYIEENYEDFSQLQAAGLDAIIFTGTNPVHTDLAQEPYWAEIKKVFDWADGHVVSVLCSCLASHLALHHFYGIQRQRLPTKRFGVFPHRVIDRRHPLVSNLNTRFDIPHSRWNDVPVSALEAHGLRLLVADRDGQMAMATSPDGFRQIYFQGHPEYDQLSLWKEFKRDLNLFYAGQLQQAPRLPRNYLSPAGMEIFERFLASDSTDTDALEAALAEEIEITWRDTAKALFANWLGLVYQLTHYDRQRQYMDGVNPADPLGLKNS